MVRPYVTCTRASQSGHYNTSNLLTCILVLICLQEKYLLLPHDCRGLVQIISVICSKGDNVVIIKGMKTLSFIVLLIVSKWLKIETFLYYVALRGILFCTKLYLSCQLQCAATTVPSRASGLKKLAEPKPGSTWLPPLLSRLVLVLGATSPSWEAELRKQTGNKHYIVSISDY